MKETCAIVRDLLPLYVEGLCSIESERYIEKHLDSCDMCREDLNRLLETEPERSGKKVIEGISKQWKQDKLRSLISGGAIVSFITSIVSILLYTGADVYVDAQGILREPFYLLGLFYAFLFIGTVLTIAVLLKKKSSAH